MINSLTLFTISIFSIVVPLLMRELGIGYEAIGLIFGFSLLFFQILRLNFATLSDFIGRKVFFTLSGVLNLFSSFVYFLASSPLGFLAGRILERVELLLYGL